MGIGIYKVFIYLDGTEDNSADTLNDLQNIDIQNSVSAEKYRGFPFMEKFWGNANEHHTARQCLNTFDALRKCKEQGIDWLVSLDADELLITSNRDHIPFDDFFGDAKIKNADIVHLSTLEVVSQKMHYDFVMAEETLFKTRKNFKSKLDQIYIKLYDPYTDTYFNRLFWFGHTMGKGILNVASDLIPENVHRYTKKDFSKPKVIKKGHVLHYHIYDSEDFIKKFDNFKDRSSTYLSGNDIQRIKRLWIRLVNDQAYGKKELEEYFKDNLLFNQQKLQALYKTRIFNVLKRREEAVIEIDIPKKILSDCQLVPTNSNIN
ncbi:glycosyltransferase family 2 protein [Subsaxibacter sp. CAU 1640]|nr:glycosyltransferase family 2 protein [Subsaxibacter sp. CAU 1640]